MRNFGGIVLILGVLGFFYAGGQKDKHPALPEGLTASETMRYPAGRWEVARYGAAGLALFGLLMAFFPKGR